MFLSARQSNCKSVVVSTLDGQQQHFLISREIFMVSYGAANLMRPAASLARASGNQAALGVRETLLRVRRVGQRAGNSLSRDGPAPCRLPTALRHYGARPAAHLTSPTLSTGAMQIASPLFPRALLTLASRCCADWHWPN